MTSADIMRFVIIISLGVLAFITFLVAGTLIGLMWLDSWSCGQCKQYPAGIYILGVLGLLLLGSMGQEAGEAPETWRNWVQANIMTLVIMALSLVTFMVVVNWWWWFGR